MSTVREEHAAAFDAEQFARGFHLYNDELRDDPYPVIDRLRAQCPVARSDLMGGFWVVTRYQDCRFVLQNHALFSSVQNIVPDIRMTTLGPDIPTQIDPPDHGKYRQILNPLLSPRAVAPVEPRMRALATELIDVIAAAGRCDFLADFAVPFPSLIFVPLMGLPESDLGTFLDWKNKILHTTDEAQRAEIFETVNAELQAYFTAVFHERRRRADPGDDLVGQLAQARFDGERLLSLEEFVGMACLLWGAGLDTVTAQLSLAIHHLATHPDLRDELAADLALVPTAIEELMRFDSLVNDCRKATADVEIGGKTIKAGDMVMVMYGAACATRSSSRTRTASICAGTLTGTSGSEGASTGARARTWRGSSCAWPWRRSTRGCPVTRSTRTGRPSGTSGTCAGWTACTWSWRARACLVAGKRFKRA